MLIALPIDDAPPASLVVSGGGHPVWPIRTAAQRAALERLCALFACELAPTVSQPGDASSDRGDVVGIGAEVEDATRLYAHLTRRRARLIRTPAELTDAVPDVVVTTTALLEPELLDRLYRSDGRGAAPGIVCAKTAAQLETQVLVRSAAAAIAGRSPVRSIEVYPTLGFGIRGNASDLLFGRDADPQLVRSALQAGAEVAAVVSHGDGIDALLHATLFLCPMRTRPVLADLARAPCCIATGRCMRHGIAVDEVLRSDRVMDPESLQARVLVWGVCHGVLSDQEVLDPAWGMLDRLLDGAGLGAFITSWGVVLISPASVGPLLRSLARGASVGTALARLNRSALARRSGLRLCLFGDPEVRIPDPLPRRELPRLPRWPAATRNESDAPLGDGEFLRAYLASARSRCSGELNARATAAVRALEEYEQALWTGAAVEADDASPGPRMRRAVLDFLYLRGTVISHDWMGLVRSMRTIASSVCSQCGAMTSDTVSRMRVPGARRRRMRVCPRCGIIEDVPVETRLTLRVDGHRVLVEGELPARAWTAGLRLGCSDAPRSHGHFWPAGPDGAPVRSFAPQRPWPPGPLKIALILVTGTSLAILQSPGRECGAEAGT